jgi:hypothetical protein
MNDEIRSHLKKYYLELNKNISTKKKNEWGSLLLCLLDMKGVDQIKILRESCISNSLIPKSIIKYLMDNKYILESNNPGHFYISAHGIWAIESNDGTLDNFKFIEYFNSKIFNFPDITKKSLIPKHKVILLSMIAIRAFSKESMVNLHAGDMANNALIEITDRTYELLKNLKIVSDINELYGKKAADKPLINLYRHTEDLRKRTNTIAQAPGNLKYYLDLYNGKTFEKEKLEFLFSKLFDGSDLTPIGYEKLYNFCCDISRKYYIYIFPNQQEHIFETPKYDKIIKDVIDSIRYSRINGD